MTYFVKDNTNCNRILWCTFKIARRLLAPNIIIISLFAFTFSESQGNERTEDSDKSEKSEEDAEKA